MVGPVVAVGLDVVAAEDVVVVFAHDGDGVVGDQNQDRGVCVGAADTEVVQAAAVAQGEFAELVDGVVADAEVAGGVVGRAGCGSGLVGLRDSPVTYVMNSHTLSSTREVSGKGDVGIS